MQHKSHTHPTPPAANKPISLSLQMGEMPVVSLDTAAMVGFDATQSNVSGGMPGHINVGLQQLDPLPAVEVWHSELPLMHAESGAIRFSENSEMLFACLLVEEARYADMLEASYIAYQQILTLLEEQGYPHLLRIWNYFPNINAAASDATGPDELTRYQAFCQGRYRALAEKPHYLEQLSAATVIGTHSQGMLIYFLAAKQPGIAIENPRQVSAFNYPTQYGPQSPSFARAVIKRWGNDIHLYISGTASIVGHESRHHDDVLEQLEEIIDNLQALLDTANASNPLGISSPSELSVLKVYLRDAVDYAVVRQRLRELVGETPALLFLQGDVCRSELLLEIEAFYAGANP